MNIKNFNWNAMPLLRLMVPFILGVLFAIWQASNWLFVAQIAFFVSLIVAFLAHFLPAKSVAGWQYKTFAAAIFLNLWSLGYWRTVAHDERNAKNFFAKQLSENNATSYDKKMAIVEILDVDERENTHRLRAHVRQLQEKNDSWQQTSGNIWLYWRKNSDSDLKNTTPQYQLPKVGDWWLINAHFSELEVPKNPNTFDFKNYSHFKNIHYQAFIESKNAQLIAERRGNVIFQFANDCKIHFLSILKKHLPTENEYAVGAALLLGENTFGGDEVRNAYVETGAVHILAVSGMHVGLIYFALSLFLRRFAWFKSPRGRWVESLLALSLIGFFAILTGLGGSVLRACAMFGLITLGKAWQRHGNIWNILAGSLFVLLLFDPFLCADVGLQLSFLAVVGIAFFYPRIYKRFFFQHKMIDHAWQITALGIAAQLVVTPISLFYFHRFPAYFWLSGLLLVPISTVALYLGIGLFVVEKIGMGFLNTIIGKILFGFLKLMNFIIFGIQKLPPPSIMSEISISASVMFLIYIIFIFMCLTIWHRRLSFALFGGFLTLFLTVNFAYETVEKSQNRQIIFYHFGKNTLFEVFDKKKCVTFSNNFSDLKKVKMTTENMHISLKIKSLEAVSIDSSITTPSLWWKEGVLNFYGKTMIAIDYLPRKDVTLHINTVFIYDNPRLTMSDLHQIFQAERYVFDASNANWQIEKWVRECDSLKVSYHNIKKDGAFIWKF